MKVRLGDVFDLQMGKTPSRNNSDYWGGENKWVSISDLSACDKYIFNTKECISDKAVQESGIKKVPANTVLMSFKLSIGKVAITASELYTNEAIMAFIDKGKNQFNKDYLYYLFNGIDWTEGSNKAVKGLTLNKATLTQKYIYLPTLQIQSQVVKKLDRLSDLIEKRKQQLEKLDLLVKSKFNKMFANQKTTKIKIGDIFSTTSGGTPDKSHAEYYENGNIPWLTSGEVAQGMIFNIKKRISEEGLENSSAKWMPENTVVVAMYGATAGQVGLLKISTTSNQAVCGILPNKRFNPLYLFYAILSKKEWMISQCAGGAQPNISQAVIKKMEISEPPLREQDKFATFVEQIQKTRIRIEQSLEKLQTLKKALMQKYFG